MRQKRIFLIVFAVLLCCGGLAKAGTWVALDMPEASGSEAPGGCGTYVNDISGNYLTGSYYDASSNAHGFLYNMTTQSWTTLDVPGTSSTIIQGIDGSNITGISSNGIFLYSTTTGNWSTINEADWEIRHVSISGSNIVGLYDTGRSFLYDIITQSWSSFSVYSNSVEAYGIDSSNIVGWYFNSHQGKADGFLYDMATQNTTSLEMPGANGTYAQDISNDYIVGEYNTGYATGSFLYNITTQSWIPLDLMPGATVTGIDGRNIVGFYGDSSGVHSFIYTIPEPATFLSLGLGVFLLRKPKRRMRKPE